MHKTRDSLELPFSGVSVPIPGSMRLTRFARPLACGLLCALAAACADSPTAPTSFVHEAGGSTWVAVAEPAGMPDARGWLPYLAPGAAAEVRTLRDEAARARREGDLERFLALESRAHLRASEMVAKAPPPAKVLDVLAALESWRQRALERLEEGEHPELDAARVAVEGHRDAARRALAQGDTAAAVASLARAAEAARDFSPVSVALRLISQSEGRIDADPSPSADLKRARLLLRTAREAMATGDQTRAMKRAWYALQIIDNEARRTGR